jgi:hypothetical protein
MWTISLREYFSFFFFLFNSSLPLSQWVLILPSSGHLCLEVAWSTSFRYYYFLLSYDEFFATVWVQYLMKLMTCYKNESTLVSQICFYHLPYCSPTAACSFSKSEESSSFASSLMGWSYPFHTHPLAFAMLSPWMNLLWLHVPNCYQFTLPPTLIPTLTANFLLLLFYIFEGTTLHAVT